MDRVCMVVQSHSADGRVRRQAEALASEGIGTDVICLRAKMNRTSSNTAS